MVQSRLELIARDIAQTLSPSQARAVALLAVRAVASLLPADPVVQEVVAAIERGDWRAAQTRCAPLEPIAVRLDEHYLQLHHSEGEQNTPGVIDAFSRARALDTLVIVLGPDETMAAKEAVYEAHAALGEIHGERLLAQVRSIIGTA